MKNSLPAASATVFAVILGSAFTAGSAVAAGEDWRFFERGRWVQM